MTFLCAPHANTLIQELEIRPVASICYCWYSAQPALVASIQDVFPVLTAMTRYIIMEQGPACEVSATRCRLGGQFYAG